MKALNLVAVAALLFSVGMARAESTTTPPTSNEPAKVSEPSKTTEPAKVGEQKPVEGTKMAKATVPSKKKHKRHDKKEVKQ